MKPQATDEADDRAHSIGAPTGPARTLRVNRPVEGDVQYRLLVESVMDYAIFMLDPDGHILTWNVGAQRIKGYTAQEIIGRHFSTFYTEPDRARHHPDAELEIARAEGRYEEEGWRVRKDGTTFWANVVITTLRDDEGRIVGFAKVTRDLTERRAAEQRLREQAEELEAFAYSVSHDLRTPVRHITGFASLLRNALKGRLDDKSAQYLTIINDAALRMNVLIDAMLDLSRSGRQALQLEAVDLNALLSAVRADLETELDERRVTWEVAPLPVVRADGDTLRQVLANLLGNALKYTRTREAARIEVWAEEREQEVAVFVRDNGVGFDPKYQERLFGAFQRLHRTDEFEGTGVGLATVRRIIHRHGGQVWAQSDPDQGAVFSFTLPK